MKKEDYMTYSVVFFILGTIIFFSAYHNLDIAFNMKAGTYDYNGFMFQSGTDAHIMGMRLLIVSIVFFIIGYVFALNTKEANF